MPKRLDPKGKPPVRVHMVAAEDLILEIDNWRAEQPGVPGKSEAIRRLVILGLKAAKKAPKHGR